MRARPSPNGFTLVEVMLAAILLVAGIGAILATSARTAGMVLRGRQSARAMHATTARVERLRLQSGAAAPLCPAPATGADSAPGGVAVDWAVRPNAGAADVVVRATVPVPGGQRTDSLVARVSCP